MRGMLRLSAKLMILGVSLAALPASAETAGPLSATKFNPSPTGELLHLRSSTPSQLTAAAAC